MKVGRLISGCKPGLIQPNAKRWVIDEILFSGLQAQLKNLSCLYKAKFGTAISSPNASLCSALG